MTEKTSKTVLETIMTNLESLTPKGKMLGQFILQNPRKAVFMTTKELSEACKVSEATVVRFVSQLEYGGYGDFLQALRDIVDTGLTLPDRNRPSRTGGARHRTPAPCAAGGNE